MAQNWSTLAEGLFQPFCQLDPVRTAHIVIDLQNGFVAEGSPFEIPLARAIVDNVNTISQQLRAAGGTVIYVRFMVDPNEEHSWTSFWGRRSSAATLQSTEAFARGATTHAIWPGLIQAEGDLTVDKTRPSALVPGTCPLPEELERRGITTLIITGALTNCCCESTARDAGQRNFNVLFAHDACAALDPQAHTETCKNLSLFGFADVRSTEEISYLIRQSQRDLRP